MKRGDRVVVRVARRGRRAASAAAPPPRHARASIDGAPPSASGSRQRRPRARARSARCARRRRRAATSACSASSLDRRRAAPPSPRSASSSARRTIADDLPRRQRLERGTRARGRAAAPMTSNEGFSVVAPISVTVPSSTCGSSASCCALLKRWISSMNRIVRRPPSRRRSLRPRRSRAQVGDARRSPPTAARSGAAVRCAMIARERRLPGARRPPQDQRRQLVALDHRAAAARPAPTQMLLPDELVEVARPHARGERRAGRRRGHAPPASKSARTALRSARRAARRGRVRHASECTAGMAAPGDVPPPRTRRLDQVPRPADSAAPGGRAAQGGVDRATIGRATALTHSAATKGRRDH